MAETKPYMVVSAEGEAVNAVSWDGETEFDPGEGLQLVERTGPEWIGWKREGKRWVEPAAADPEP